MSEQSSSARCRGRAAVARAAVVCSELAWSLSSRGSDMCKCLFLIAEPPRRELRRGGEWRRAAYAPMAAARSSSGSAMKTFEWALLFRKAASSAVRARPVVDVTRIIAVERVSCRAQPHSTYENEGLPLSLRIASRAPAACDVAAGTEALKPHGTGRRNA